MAKATGKALTNWDEKFAAAAKQSKKTAQGRLGVGNFWSLKAGIMSFNGQSMVQNEAPFIICDFVLENQYFPGEYDEGKTVPPACYAFGRSEEEMAPHPDVVAREEHQNGTCEGCEHNEWASGRGRGKACKNVLRLALVVAGTFKKGGDFEPFSPEDIAGQKITFMKVPVTSCGGISQYIDNLDEVQGRPPFGAFTRLYTQPDRKSQFKLMAEPLGVVPKEYNEVVFELNEKAAKIIDAPYPTPEEAQAEQPQQNMRRGGQPGRAPRGRASSPPPAQPAAAGGSKRRF
jgi:hypothetical protein